MEVRYGQVVVKKSLRLRPDLAERLEMVARDLGCSENAYITRVLARALKNHIPLGSYLASGPVRGTGKQRHRVDAPPLSRYDASTCDPASGWPLRLPDSFWLRREVVGYGSDGAVQFGEVSRKPDDPVRNLRDVMQFDPKFARELLNSARGAAGLEPVTEEQWTATRDWALA